MLSTGRRFIKSLFNYKVKYLQYWNTCPIDEHLILLEAGQGKNINGNMFAILKELETNIKWKDYSAYFVVTEQNLEAAKERIEFYQFKKCRLVIRNTKEYVKILATAKYLMTDNSFPIYMNKREGQVYINTWHGTPLKNLGVSDLRNAASLTNIQKNYLMCDYALFPNHYTKDIFMEDYQLKNIFRGKNLVCDYPRNAVLLDSKYGCELRHKLGLDGKQLIAYMPTWRGTDPTMDADMQKKILIRYLNKIDKELREDQIFYTNLHFLVNNTLDYSNYKHIRKFPSEYETYEFLNICDMLVTDYSSVFFDFALTKKPIILFAYDKENYIDKKGTYFPLDTLPFPITETVKSLIDRINDYHSKDATEFFTKYCEFADINTCEKVLDLMIAGNEEGLHIEDPPNNGKPNILVHGGDLMNTIIREHTSVYVSKLDLSKYNVIFSFEKRLTPAKAEYIESLQKGVQLLGIVNGNLVSRREKIKFAATFRYRSTRSAFLDQEISFKRERNRIFHKIPFEVAVVFNISNNRRAFEIETIPCEKEWMIYPEAVVGYKKVYKKMAEFLTGETDRLITFDNDEVIRRQPDPAVKIACMQRMFKFVNICSIKFKTKRQFRIFALSVSKACFKVNYRDTHIQIEDISLPIRFLFKTGIPIGGKKRLNFYCLDIPFEKALQLPVNNKISLVCKSGNHEYTTRIIYSVNANARNKAKCVKIMPENNSSIYLWRTKGNSLFIVVRKLNHTDYKKEQIKLFWAWLFAKITPKKDIILLFEKESSGYEESGSVVYEKIIDEGYQNAYFILDSAYPYYDEIGESYKQNIIPKHSFKHYYYFFKCGTFIGSEALVHAIELRVINKHALAKIIDKTINYVFLQHGVMYMVSLDSASRTFFKPHSTNGVYRVVVSSQEEANHFVFLGSHKDYHMYICGLPKFDRNTRNEGADKIIIMPTWRPWEYNDARLDFQDTKYYKMIERIVRAIPVEYHPKLIVLPHPLFAEMLKEEDSYLNQFIVRDVKYDDILKDTKVLITDYSSIAYDAFYRNSNVIFYWEEKEECLVNYGNNTKLMLNEENAFGDICYKAEDITNVIEENYLNSPTKEKIEKYEKIVTFRDGHNTDRLVRMLKEDGLLKRK